MDITKPVALFDGMEYDPLYGGGRITRTVDGVPVTVATIKACDQYTFHTLLAAAPEVVTLDILTPPWAPRGPKSHWMVWDSISRIRKHLGISKKDRHLVRLYQIGYRLDPELIYEKRRQEQSAKPKISLRA
jgi:hypothetical protein